jgi:formylglycine-generating enzyme required for sulfatase activity
MGANPSKHSPGGSARHEVEGQNTDDFPVECVSWLDVQEFLNRLEARDAGGPWRHRLPTEAQWEYACRATAVSTEPFCFRAPSRSLTASLANFDSNVPYGGGKPDQPIPWRPRGVGSYDPNPLGLYDLHGNVWEWCSDWYGPYEAGPLSDPSGPADGTERTCRGGSWISDGEDCRAASRIKHRPSERNARLGFRVAAVRHGGG